MADLQWLPTRTRAGLCQILFRQRANDVTSIADLFIYPLKGGRAIAQTSVKLVSTGFEWDRHWMAIDATGSFLTQRTHPRLALIQPRIGNDALILQADGFASVQVPLHPEGDSRAVRVWKDRCSALDQGDRASEWISEVLKDSARLVRIPERTDRMADATYAGPDPTPVAFPDGYPILVVNRASLDDLNTRMPEAVPMSRFRPNIVLEGLSAFAEDSISTLHIGGVSLRLVKPCTRCVVTSTDQRTGERTVNPLPVLRQFRWSRELLGVTFGENAVIAAGVGQTIERGAACVARMDEPVPA
jgi:uncharacterized protein